RGVRRHSSTPRRSMPRTHATHPTSTRSSSAANGQSPLEPKTRGAPNRAPYRALRLRRSSFRMCSSASAATVLPVVGVIVPIVIVVIAVTLQIHAVQEHTDDPALHRLDLFRGPTHDLVRNSARSNDEDDAVALSGE